MILKETVRSTVLTQQKAHNIARAFLDVARHGRHERHVATHGQCMFELPNCVNNEG